MSSSSAYQKIQEALLEARNSLHQRQQYVFSKVAFLAVSFIESKHEKIIWNIKNNTKYGVTNEVVFQLDDVLSQVEGDTITHIKSPLEQYILDTTGIPFKIKMENEKHIYLLLKI